MALCFFAAVACGGDNDTDASAASTVQSSSSVASGGGGSGGSGGASSASSSSGMAAMATLAPTKASWTIILPGQPSDETLFTVTNAGGGTVKVTKVEFTQPSSGPQGKFSESSNTCTGKSLGPNQTCTIGVKVIDSMAGNQSAATGSLNVTTDAAVAPLTAELSFTVT